MTDKWNMIVDVAKCENCHNCVLAVKDEFIGNDFPGYSAPQPSQGQEWLRISRKIRGTDHLVDVAYRPSMCNHCDDAPCVKAGGGCISKREDGIVLIDPVKSKGRQDLVEACPYGNISWNEELSIPQHWTFDAHLLDNGWKEPRAAQACPTGAMKSIKHSDEAMARMVKAEGLETMPSRKGAKPRVWYKNMHRFTKCFIGGSVVAEVAGVSDCVEGAAVTLMRNGQTVAQTKTDTFGDFKFDGLEGDGSEYEGKIVGKAGKAGIKVTLNDTVCIGDLTLA